MGRHAPHIKTEMREATPTQIIVATVNAIEEWSVTEAATHMRIPKSELYMRKELNPVWAKAFFKSGEGLKESHWRTTPALIAQAQREMRDITHGIN